MSKNFRCLLLILSGITVQVFAIVPTTDIYQQSTDISTTSQYAGQVTGYLGQMGNAMNAAEQVQSLKGLAQVQGSGQVLCQLCTKSDQAQLASYVNSINDDLCSQFSQSMTNITGAQQSITNLQQIIATFATNPKAAGLALQQAAIATQTATQNTLAQMQMMQAQAVQKQLAQEKYTRTLISNSTNIQPGL
jgi:hypothetical protein